MLRLPSQRAVKTLRSPLRNPLRNPLPSPLCKPLQIRHVHIEQAPFSGSPGYATITRRFSSYPNPLYFFTEKRAKERIERGEFVDIHDIGRADPTDYDVLITDVDDSILRSQISELVGVPYLQEATKEEANKVVETGSGFLYGRNSRTIFPCVVSYNGDARWIFFIVDSSSPLTYLSAPVSCSYLYTECLTVNLTLGGQTSWSQKLRPCTRYNCWIPEPGSIVTEGLTLCQY
jgi:hypothetical protein